MDNFPKSILVRLLAILMAGLCAVPPLAAQTVSTVSSTGNFGVNPQLPHHMASAHALPSIGNKSDRYPPFVIGPGDLLVVSVYGESELPVEYQVDANGCIVIPYAGAVKVEGLSPTEASSKIAKALSKRNKVSVLIEESNTYWISVLGNVVHPGKYQIRGRPTLLSALGEAGGPLSGSNLSSDVVIRKNKSFKVSLDKYLNGEASDFDQPLLYPGDTLVVPQGGWPRGIGDVAAVFGIIASVAVIIYYSKQADIIKF